MSKEKLAVMVQSVSKFHRSENDGGDEQVLFNSIGYMEKDNDEIKIKYPELKMDGENTAFSTIFFKESDPTDVVIVRNSPFKESFHFSKNIRNVEMSLAMPFGDVDFQSNTKSIKNSIKFGKGGKLEVEYSVDVGMVFFENVELSITVKPK